MRLRTVAAMVSVLGVSAGAFAASASTAGATANPVAITLGQPVGVTAGDYLLTASGVTASSSVYGTVSQSLAGTGSPLRDATFLAGATAQTVTAEVRVSAATDVFTLAGSTSIAASSVTLTRAAWSFVVRGQAVTSPTSAAVTWHGVNIDPAQKNPSFSDLATYYPRDTIVRLMVNEECFDAFFWASSNAKDCPGVNGGSVGASYYQAVIQNDVSRITATGEVALISVTGAGRDSAGWWPSKSTDLFGPDQQTLAVYNQLAQMYASNPLVVFETTNEPEMSTGSTYPPNWIPGGPLWLSGGVVTVTGVTWNEPGVQQIVNQIRTAGNTNPIMVEGSAYGSNLLTVEGTPVVGTNLIYSFHAYNSPDNSATCPSTLSWAVAPLVSPTGQFRYAGFMSEFGTTQTDIAPPAIARGSQYLANCISVANGLGAGWAAWGWYPTSYDTYGLLKTYFPLTPTSRGATVAKAF